MSQEPRWKREDRKEYHKQWRIKNKDKIRAWDLKWRPRRKHSVTRFLTRYKYSAQKRDIVWLISDEDVMNIAKKACHYCGHPADPFNGLDRMYNEYGYYLGNVLPCCGACNRAKKDQPYDEFKKYLDRIVEFRSRKK